MDGNECADAAQEFVTVHTGKADAFALPEMPLESIHGGGIDLGKRKMPPIQPVQ
ncbi:5-carboxymethyl-2-hydroxymuconate isomerase [Ralstonia solanacearum]|nr:glutathione S-transferase [Ralstonia solanacearum]ARU21589.1 5-carboxymethyl-2-hydroxymuconate isomerase [Ralstonia solanacearum]